MSELLSSSEVATVGELAGQVALVVGGGSGIGSSTAALLRERGAEIVILGPDGPQVLAVAEGLNGLGISGDAADVEVCQAAVMAATDRWGRLDHLVSCAGIGTFGAVSDLDERDWQATMRANVETALAAARACLPAMIAAGGGTITLVASLAGLIAVPASAAYVASKHALIGLARSLAVDYGAHGVRCNAVCPGLVETPMGDHVMDTLGGAHGLSREEAYRRVARSAPLRTHAQPRDIAEVITFLISPRARVVTGQVIVADCGVMAADSSILAAFPDA